MFRETHGLGAAIPGVFPGWLRQPRWTTEAKLVRELVRPNEQSDLHFVALVSTHQRRIGIALQQASNIRTRIKRIGQIGDARSQNLRPPGHGLISIIHRLAADSAGTNDLRTRWSTNRIRRISKALVVIRIGGGSGVR